MTNDKNIHIPDGESYSIYAPEEGRTPAPWVQFYDEGVSASISPMHVPLYYWLDRSAQKFPNSPAIIFKNYRINYRQLLEGAEIIAANLRAHGIQKGDRVVLMMPNLPQTILAFWGVIKAGAVAVMTNPLYMSHELLHQLNDCEAKAMITVDFLWPKIKELRNDLGINKYFLTSMNEFMRLSGDPLCRFKVRRPRPLTGSASEDRRDVMPFARLLNGRKRLSVPIKNPNDDLALLQYTGGTTGIPKGAMLTHSNMVANQQQILEVLKAIVDKPNNRFLAVLPFFHVYALNTCLILPTACGAAICCTPRFNPIEAMHMIHKQRITVFPGAPAVYIAVMQNKDIADYDLSSLLACISGSAPMPVEYMRAFREKTNCIIVEGYGLTEASPVTNVNPVFGRQKPGTIGLPLPGTEARIVDMELGNIPLPPDGVGELIVRGPQVMKGYWKRPDETANVLRNGWLYTGDIASMDEQGYVSIVDRKKDLVITGGYNVYPREVDELLYTHPKIQDAVCVGVPHGARGEVLKAYIVLKPGEQLAFSEITAFCRGKLANYKVPRMVEFRDELPRNQVGKILRRTLRAEEEKRRTKNAPEPEEQITE